MLRTILNAALALLAASLVSGCLQTMPKCVSGNCVDGTGMLISPNGMIYEGEFAEGGPHGKGTRSGPDMHTCVGNWNRGLLEGYATCTKKNENIVGNYSNAGLQGVGMVYRDDGSVVQRGIYNQGRLVTSLSADEFNRQFVAAYGISPPGVKAAPSKESLLQAEIKKKTEQLAASKGISAKNRQKLAEDKKRLEADLKRLNAEEAERQKTALAAAAQNEYAQQSLITQEASQLEGERKQLEEEKRRLKTQEVEKRLAEEKAKFEREQKELEAARMKTASTQPARPKLRRTALVIGNGAYVNMGRLKNPTNDARDMAAALTGLGFGVTLLLDADKRQMEEAVRSFGHSLEKGGMGLFYYAGHGIQASGENYLIPVNAEIHSEADIRYGCLNAGLVLAKMEDAKNNPNIIILDACRNNPYARSFSRSAAGGLAQMDAPSGSLIAYSTAPGKVASDGTGTNGRYTKHLLSSMANPQLSIVDLFKQVRINVAAESGREQIPWEAQSLFDKYYLRD